MKAETASLESDSEHATLEDATSSFFQTLTHLLGEKEVHIYIHVYVHVIKALEIVNENDLLHATSIL